jgi:3-hydroxyacyl-CoA dehydrogenase
LPDPETAALIERTAREAGIPRREISQQEIVERCIYGLVNEGAQILEEGIALRAVDIDIVYLNGYGFPRERGGPMFYADTIGVAEVLARIEEFGWKPSPLLRKLAAEGKTFD